MRQTRRCCAGQSRIIRRTRKRCTGQGRIIRWTRRRCAGQGRIRTRRRCAGQCRIIRWTRKRCAGQGLIIRWTRKCCAAQGRTHTHTVVAARYVAVLPSSRDNHGGPAEADHRFWEAPRDSPIPPQGATNRRPASGVDYATQTSFLPGRRPAAGNPTQRPRGTQHHHGCQLQQNPTRSRPTCSGGVPPARPCQVRVPSGRDRKGGGDTQTHTHTLAAEPPLSINGGLEVDAPRGTPATAKRPLPCQAHRKRWGASPPTLPVGAALGWGRSPGPPPVPSMQSVGTLPK